MAIKGKSRPKARRAVTPGPRPAYVPIKRKWYARREIQAPFLTVLVIAAIAGLVYGFVHERDTQREQDLQAKMTVAMTRYQAAVQPNLSPLGTAQGPTFQLLPKLTNDATALQKGTADPATVEKEASTFATTTKNASTALGQIDATSIVAGKGFDEPFVLYVINANSRMTHAVEIGHEAAVLLGQAARATGQEQKALAASVMSLLDTANKLFNDGYTDYINAQGLAGTYQPSLPGSTGGPAQAP
jgi:hypothetical protein